MLAGLNGVLISSAGRPRMTRSTSGILPRRILAAAQAQQQLVARLHTSRSGPRRCILRGPLRKARDGIAKALPRRSTSVPTTEADLNYPLTDPCWRSTTVCRGRRSMRPCVPNQVQMGLGEGLPGQLLAQVRTRRGRAGTPGKPPPATPSPATIRRRAGGQQPFRARRGAKNELAGRFWRAP